MNIYFVVFGLIAFTINSAQAGMFGPTKQGKALAAAKVNGMELLLVRLLASAALFVGDVIREHSTDEVGILLP